MLGPGNDEAALEALAAFPGGLQVGGGITADSATRWLDAGARHVIVTSYVFSDGKVDRARLAELVAVVGKERLVLDLSCRRLPGSVDGPYFVVTDKWQKYTDVQVNAETLRELAESCDEFLVHGVENEGKRCGILEDLVKLLGDSSPIPVTYAGTTLLPTLRGYTVSASVCCAGVGTHVDVSRYHRRLHAQNTPSKYSTLRTTCNMALACSIVHQCGRSNAFASHC
jgi:phosphoribosylformimino-5-aminoimidazole carboxamide ribotide isomerase